MKQLLGLAVTAHILSYSSAGFAQCDEAGLIETTTPAPPYSTLAVTRHLRLVADSRDMSAVDVVAVGDSIVQLWPEELLKLAMSSNSVLNLGVGSDRIQNTLWRLRTGHFDHIRANQVLVLLGTNNIGSDPTCAVLAGYQLLVNAIDQTFHPQRIIFVEILRRQKGPDSLENERLRANAEIRKLTENNPKLTTVSLDVRQDFFEADGLHLNTQGYIHLSDELRESNAHAR
jgi:lysophospholipase L1-like esterase